MERPDVLALAQKKGWSEACAQGFLDGQRFRTQGERPPGAALYGIGQYSLGFRAGFFGIPLIDSVEDYPFYMPGVRRSGGAASPWTGPERRKSRVEKPSAMFGGRHARREGES